MRSKLIPVFFAARNNPSAEPDSDPVVKRNIRFLYLEVIYASLLGAFMSFNSAFAIHLGASKELIAILTAVPALVIALGSIPSARFIETRRNRKTWLVSALVAGRVGYVVVALIPAFVPGTSAAVWLVIWLIVLNIPAAFFTSGFHALLGDLVPEKRRAFVFSRRSIFASVGVVLATWLAGVWLDRVKFPGNYQWMYLFGVVIAMGSNHYVAHLKLPHHQTPPREARVTASPRTQEPVKMSGPMARFLFNMGFYQFGLTLPSSLFTIYYIELLHATDYWIGLNGAASSIGVIFGYIIWERLARRHDFMWVLKRSTLLTWMFPVFAALVPNLTGILLIGCFVNLMHPGVDIGNFNTMLKLTNPEHRTVYMGWYNAILNGCMFVAPLVGVWISNLLSIPATLLLSGILRIIGGWLFTVNRVEVPAVEEAAVSLT